jgi:hypothetical protein
MNKYLEKWLHESKSWDFPELYSQNMLFQRFTQPDVEFQLLLLGWLFPEDQESVVEPADVLLQLFIAAATLPDNLKTIKHESKDPIQCLEGPAEYIKHLKLEQTEAFFQTILLYKSDSILPQPPQYATVSLEKLFLEQMDQATKPRYDMNSSRWLKLQAQLWKKLEDFNQREWIKNVQYKKVLKRFQKSE